MKRIIAIPPFYKGTSFEDIVASLKLCIKDVTADIEFVGFLTPFDNTVPEDKLDTNAYIKGQVELLGLLQSELETTSHILFLDFCNPGIDTLLYQMEQGGFNVKLGSLFHGASFIDNDFQKDQRALYPFEQAWLSTYDAIYIPSEHAKQTYFPNRAAVKVYRWGLDSINQLTVPNRAKKWDVIFPHRLNEDKGVVQFFEIVQKFKDMSFCVAVPKEEHILKGNIWYERLRKLKNVYWVFNESGQHHFNTLAGARIILSCSRQELFGYSVTKAIMAGCIPVVPDEMVYKELIPEMFRYNSHDDLNRLIETFGSNQPGSNHTDAIKKLQKTISKYSFKDILKDFFL